jgi:hypothetical protein
MLIDDGLHRSCRAQSEVRWKSRIARYKGSFPIPGILAEVAS